MHLSDGEKLILYLLSEIQSQLKLNSDTDPAFIQQAITSGHLWALKEKYGGIFEADEKPAQLVKEVEDILWMWSLLEASYAALSPRDKQRVNEEADNPGDVRFKGFDGNYESPYLSTADFIIKHMGKYQEFARRKLNSHSPSLEMHRRMLAAFGPGTFEGGRLTADTMIAILKVQYPPPGDTGRPK